MKIFEINGHWKDDGAEFEHLLVADLNNIFNRFNILYQQNTLNLQL